VLNLSKMTDNFSPLLCSTDFITGYSHLSPKGLKINNTYGSYEKIRKIMTGLTFQIGTYKKNGNLVTYLVSIRKRRFMSFRR